MKADCTHLSQDDRAQLQFSIDVLLAKVSTAERVERACVFDLRPGADVLPPRSEATEVLYVLSAVRTAKDLLKIQCDAATVSSAMLSQVVTQRSPTWPTSRLQPSFMAEVAHLLKQKELMSEISNLAEDLDDESAEAVRHVLRRGLAAEAGARDANCALKKIKGVVDVLELSAIGPDASQVADAFTAADGSRFSTESKLLPTSGGPLEQSSQPWDQPAALDPRALVVLLGSALVGLRAADALPPAKQHARALEAVQLLAPLAHGIGLGGGAFAELESLSYARLFPESLRNIRGWYMQVWPDGDALVPQLCAMLDSQLQNAPSLSGLIDTLTITGRVKSVTSTFRKLLRDDVGRRAAENVRDAVALRIVVQPSAAAAEQLTSVLRRPAALSEAEVETLVCFGAYRQMLRLWPEVPGRFKDFVTHPKGNGYQSLHTNVRLPDGRTVEVQIRSTAMHSRAEYGTAAHNAYRAAQLGATTDSGLRDLTPLLPAGATKLLAAAED